MYFTKPLILQCFLLFVCLIGQVNFIYSQSLLPELDQKIPVQKLKADFEIMRENIEKLHIGLYSYTSKEDLDKAFDEIEAEINHPLTSMEFFRKLTRLNKLIGNSHTGFSPPKDIMEAIRKTLPKLPFKTFWDGTNLYVLENLSSDENMKEGSKIISINGIPAETLIKQMTDMIKRDGFNQTYPIHSLNSDFSLHYSVLKEIPKLFEIELEDASGNVLKANVDGLSADKLEENRFARYKKRKVEFEKTKEPALTFSINGDVAVLIIKTFQEDVIKKKKQNWKKIFKSSFKRISEKSVKHLIIDLRDNSGGQPKPTIALLSYLHDKPFKLYKSINTNVGKLSDLPYFVDDGSTETFNDTGWVKNGDFFETKDKGVFKIHKPSKNAFQGKLYILINAFSGSATGTLAGQLSSRTKAIFIGEETGGNPNQTVARQIVRVILPNSKVKVSIPLVLSVKDVNFENTGRGVIPDYIISPTISDMLKRKDPVMAFTLNLILENL